MSFETIPKDLRGLRACLVCSMVKVSIRTQISNHDNSQINTINIMNSIYCYFSRLTSLKLMDVKIVKNFFESKATKTKYMIVRAAISMVWLLLWVQKIVGSASGKELVS